MVKPKVQSKKQQKRGGIDFKKIKRKIGRKLPPPKNATNTEIKSKAIVLPEQSVASEKAGLAVSKKGLTLKELLQQTSHHNAKVRKDALIGIRDIFVKYPAELKLHKLAAIEKLRERISDDDRLVRETLYQLFKSVVLPSCKDDNQGPLISLMMAYIFSAMTHLATDVRLMAFKFFDLLVQNYPSSFYVYGEKILQNYEDILRKTQFHLQDKSKLKTILAGLVHCLTLLPCNKRVDDSSLEKEIPPQVSLHAAEADADEDSIGLSGISNKLKDLLPILVSCFQDFMPLVHAMAILDAQSFDCMLFILESIDLVVKFFVHEIGRSQKSLLYVPSHYERKANAVTWDQIMSPAILKKLWDVFPLNSINSDKDDDRYFTLNAIITEIFLRLSEWSYLPPALLENFLGFVESSLIEKISSCTQSGKVLFEKRLLPLIPFIPEIIMRATSDWKSRILQAFTEVFKHSSPQSSMKLACLSVLGEMLDPEKGWLSLVSSNHGMLDYQIIWIRELPQLLVLLGDRNPLCSKAVLHLQLLIGKAAKLNSPITQAYNNIQYILKDFYSTNLDKSVCYGPFMMLTRDIQELSLCCLYYFSYLDSPLLQSLVSCCLCKDLEPLLLFRIIEVLHSIYKAGNILIADYISFLITLLSRFEVYPEICPGMNHEGMSNRETFRSVTSVVCSCLSQIGDDYLVLQALEKMILDQMLLKAPVDNICGFLRVLFTLDSNPTRLSEQSIIKLSHVLPKYLTDIVSKIQADQEPDVTVSINNSRYYLLPCFFLFDRSSMLLDLVLDSMRSFITESCFSSQSTINHSSSIGTIVFVLLLMHEDTKMKQILLSHRRLIESVLQNVLPFQSSVEFNMTIEERHRLQTACDHLKAAISTTIDVFECLASEIGIHKKRKILFKYW